MQSQSRRTYLPSGLLDLHRTAPFFLATFCIALVALNVWRLDEWGTQGFEQYLSHAIMQTTLFDFAWVLAILAVFLHRDAEKHDLSWWWILPTFPFMPTIGLLLYFIYRTRVLRRRGEVPPPLGT